MSKKKEVLKTILDIVITCIIDFAIIFVICKYFFMPMTISQTSMYPTLDDGDIGFSNIIKRKINGIERFDIVIVKTEDLRIIKRCIGLPNETVTYINDRLYINGEYVEEDFLNEEYTSTYETFTSSFEVTLGEDEYFVLGDNRPVSCDSRYYGPFTSDEIISVGAYIIYPFENFGAY